MSALLLGILNSQASGLDFGPAAYDLLETQVLASDTSSVTFSNMLSTYSSTYHSLQIRGVARSGRNVGESSGVSMRFNNDSGNNYSFYGMVASNTSSTSYTGANLSYVTVTGAPQINKGSSAYAAFYIDIDDPFSANKVTVFRGYGGFGNEVTQIRTVAGAWGSNSAVDSITFYEQEGYNLISGTRISIYGLKGS